MHSEPRVPVLRVVGLNKSYAVPVLKNVSVEFEAGSVHVLMGANGAGKSTLCNIISGIVPATSGRMEFDGASYDPQSPRDAESSGIRMVMQELNLIENLTVAENICLTDLPRSYGWIQRQALLKKGGAALRRLGINDIDPAAQVATLGLGHQQLVEITRALSQPSRLVILDEPTAALSAPQVDLLFDTITKLKSKGCAIIYISHRMDEIQRVADHITVLRDGVLVASQPADELQKDDIIELMAGGARTAPESEHQQRKPIKLAMSLKRISAGSEVKNVSLDIFAGQILGIAGLIGSGRTHLLHALFGAERITGGHLTMGEGRTPTQINSPHRAIQLGLALAPEDRKRHGLLLALSVKRNTTLERIASLSGRLGLIKSNAETALAEQAKQDMAIECTSLEQAVRELSGGNQQKVVIARCLSQDCKVVMFDEPTRGVDIAAKRTIHGLLRGLAERGAAVLVVSSEDQELMAICDRIAVMSNGSLVAEFENGAWDSQQLMAAALSGYADPQAA